MNDFAEYRVIIYTRVLFFYSINVENKLGYLWMKQ